MSGKAILLRNSNFQIFYLYFHSDFSSWQQYTQDTSKICQFKSEFEKL